jgi:hypothetical protein
MKQPAMAIRVSRENPDHHLWNNNGTWWCHFTLHLPDFTKHRQRLSLETQNVAIARSRRDALLAQLSKSPQNSHQIYGHHQ